MLNRGIASVVIFCVSVSLLNKLLPHNVTICFESLLVRPLGFADGIVNPCRHLTAKIEFIRCIQKDFLCSW